MRREFAEAYLTSRQDCRMLVNIFSCQGGECLKSCQLIEKAVIHKQPHGTGLEIRDRVRPETIVRIGYLKLKKIKGMEIDDMFLTFIYETLHIEVIIKRTLFI